MNRTLKPRNLGDILSDTFTIYKNNFWRLAAIVAIVAVPIAVLYLIVELLFPAHDGGATGTLANAIFSLLLSVTSSVVFLLMGGAVIHAVSEQYFNQPVNIGRAYSFAWDRLSDMFWATVLAGLAIYGILVAATIISLFTSMAIGVGISGWQGMMAFTAILLIIATPPALYLGITWTFIVQAALLEDCGPRAALSHSSALVKRSWWRVLGIVLLLVIIVMIITMIFYMPAIISYVKQFAAGFVPYATIEPPIWVMIATMIGGLIGDIICIPIFTISATLLYFDLRVRKQNYSLDALANELGLTSAPADTGANLPG